MSWTNAVITDAGHALQAALLGTGKGLVFTRAVSGAGLAADNLAAQTAVTDARQELTMQPAAPLEDAKTRVQAMLRNDGLETGYTMHQLGFYAKAQDSADEILYALVQDEVGDPIPSAAENPGFTADWTYIFAYGNADSVTVTVDPAGAVPWGAVGAPGGVAPLDGDGKLPGSHLPEMDFAPLTGLPTNDIRSIRVRTGNTITAGSVVNVGIADGEEEPTVYNALGADQAIALESGDSGAIVKVGYGGYCPCDAISEGEEMNSDGVCAYSPQDGWLNVVPVPLKNLIRTSVADNEALIIVRAFAPEGFDFSTFVYTNWGGSDSASMRRFNKSGFLYRKMIFPNTTGSGATKTGNITMNLTYGVGYSGPSSISVPYEYGKTTYISFEILSDSQEYIEVNSSRQIVFPPTVESIDIVLIGGGAGGDGGGAGGGGYRGLTAYNSYGGDGGCGGRGGNAGNSGEIVRKNGVSVTAGELYNLVIGSGGTGGAGGAKGAGTDFDNDIDGSAGSNGSLGGVGSATTGFGFTALGGTRKSNTILNATDPPAGFYAKKGGGSTKSGNTAIGGTGANENAAGTAGSDASGGGNGGGQESTISIFDDLSVSIQRIAGNDGGHGNGGGGGSAQQVTQSSPITRPGGQGGKSSPESLGSVVNGTYGGGGSGGNGGNGGRGGNGSYQSSGSKSVAGSDGTNGTAGGRGGNGAIFIKINYKTA